MSRKIKKTIKRSKDGASLIELLVASALLVFVTAVLGELMLLVVTATHRLSNQVDAATATRFAIERIKGDVRSGAAFITTAPNKLTLAYFTYYIDPQNDPSKAAYNPGAPANPSNGLPISVSNVTYEIVQDTNHANEYLLKRENQTVLTGIVGPIDGNFSSTIPAVFSYLQREGSTGWKVLRFPVPTAYATGVRVDLEVVRPLDTTQSNPLYERHAAAHGEVYLRNSREL